MALNFKYIRQSLGIFINFMGNPLVFFLKENLGFSGGPAFTVGSYLLGFALMTSDDFLKKLYKPNFPMLRLGVVFLTISILYLFFYNDTVTSSYDFQKDIMYYAFTFIFLCLLMSVSNEVKDYFLPIVMIFTLISSLALLYSIIKNPSYVIGMRATVQFGDGTSYNSGNPHIYARNGFAGFFASYLCLKSKNIIWRLICLGNILLSLAVIMLTQTRSIFLAFLLALGIYLFFNLKWRNVKDVAKIIFRPQNLIVLSLIIGFILNYLNNRYQLFNILSNYSDIFFASFIKAINTALGLADKEKVDLGAMGRVTSFATFKEIFQNEPQSLILGKGYRFLYMDIPIAEAFLDCGILGFLSFGILNVLIFKESILAIYRGDNKFTLFLGLYYISYFVNIFSTGQPFDLQYWFPFAVMIRFMGVKYLENPPVIIPQKYSQQSDNESFNLA
jgi:hypothetical protein